MPWGIAIGAVAGLAGSAMQSGAASDAANAQAQSAANAQQISQQEFNTITAQNAPYMQSGYGALSNLDYLLGVTPQTGPMGSASGQGYNPYGGYGGISSWSPYGTMGWQQGMGGLGGARIPIGAGQGQQGANQSALQPTASSPAGGFGSLVKPFDTSDWQKLSPAYNFQLQQGRQGVLNADTSGQGALSGAAMKDLINYNQAEANTSFNNAFNQYQTQQGNIFSRLSGIAQIGQASANNTGQQGTALAGQAAQSATNIGTAQAGGIVGSANAWAGGLSSSAPWLMAGYQKNNDPYSSDPFSISLGGSGSTVSDPGYGGQ